MRSDGNSQFVSANTPYRPCRNKQGRDGSVNRLDLRMEDEACRISSENEKPADLSFTCFQGEAWRVCHHYNDGIPASCQAFCPRGQPDRKAFECLQSHSFPSR